MNKKAGIALLAALLLAGCNNEKSGTSHSVRPVKVARAENRESLTKNFAGVVEAVNFVKLAFRVSGQIIRLPVVEGQRVQEGELIAEIDPRDLRLQYAADKAAYETATSQLERNKRLLAKQAISQQDYEISEANFQKSKSAFELATNNLHDARLYAPFAGSIEKKMAENYQRVSSGVPIVQLIDTKALRIRFTVADNYLHLLQSADKRFSVEFETYKGRRFHASLLEYLDASPDGSGIPVTIVIDDPAFDRTLYDVKPGFTCNIDFSARLAQEDIRQMVWIPLAAVFSDPATKKEYVWIVDPENRVRKREIQVYTPTGNSFAMVSQGLKSGETVVSAGVYQLSDGEPVRVLP